MKIIGSILFGVFVVLQFTSEIIALVGGFLLGSGFLSMVLWAVGLEIVLRIIQFTSGIAAAYLLDAQV